MATAILKRRSFFFLNGIKQHLPNESINFITDDLVGLDASCLKHTLIFNNDPLPYIIIQA
jgi:hypothetical protein